ncbi:glycosyltransferase family A protein [Mesorhizobium tamadayense]|nr:glycosyltransferase family 2 protein [Mesorhizobium tamadayense]
MFNAEQTIGATLAGIRRQTYQILDIVVVDDVSGLLCSTEPGEGKTAWRIIRWFQSWFLRTTHR